MKNTLGIMKGLLVCFTIATLSACSAGSSSSGGSGTAADDGDETATGGGEITETALIDATSYESYGTILSAVASSIVPSMNASDASASLSARSSKAMSLTYGEEDAWSVYLEDNNTVVLTDIFGSPDEAPSVVTKIRVLVEQFQSQAESILSADPTISCTGARVLDE